ncbi:MAG: hypothetical protein ACK5DE_05115 [Bacteroidota bacterium]
MAGWRFYLNDIEVEEPIGWDAVEFTAIRMESHGIDQPFSTELKFYQKGARIIKNLYDQYFINAEISIKIVSDVSYSGSPYEFEGMLNLSVYEEHNVCDTDSWEITVGIIDDNFREQFKSRQDVEIDITSLKDLNGDDIDPITYKNVRLHKQELYLSASASQKVELSTTLLTWDFSFVGPKYGWDITKYSTIAPTYFDNTDFVNPVGSTFDPLGLMWTYGGPFFKNNTGYARTFNFTFYAETYFSFEDIKQGQYTSGIWIPFPINDSATSNADVILSIYDSSDNYQSTVTIGSTSLVSSPGLFPLYPSFTNDVWEYSGTFTLQPDEKAFISMEIGVNGTLQRDSGPLIGPTPVLNQWYEAEWKVIWNNVCFTLSEANNGDFASFCNGLTIEQWLRRSIYILTGSDNKLLSNAFSEQGEGCYWNNLITNGLKIRNARTIDQISIGCNATDEDDLPDLTKLKTSFKETFDELDKIFCLGWAFEWTGTEWKIRIEPREYFYQNTISQTFTNVGEVTQMAKVDKLVNNITLGFNPNWKNIQISGSWAIHTDRNYFVGNRAMNEGSTANLDIRSNMICEGYAIEFSRRMSSIADGGGSSDRPNDYNLFLIWLNRNELEIESIEDSVFSIPDETGNVSFSPGTVSMPSNYINISNSPLSGLYNIFHTPARIAIRWWKVLGMHTYGLTNPRLRFQVGEYQTTYSSYIDDTIGPCQDSCFECVIPESTDIYPALFRTPEEEYLFKPIQIEFSYPQSLCDFLTLSQDEQYRKVRLTSGSLDVQGFILQASNQPEDSSGGTTKFSLIMSAQVAGEGGAFTTGFDTGFDNGE